jgi:crossover junction endodeoxyribonuclease RusA
MSRTLKLISPLPPSINGYLNYKIARRGKKQYVQSYLSRDSVSYKSRFVRYVKEQIEEQGWKTPVKNQYVDIEMVFYLEKKGKDPSNFIKMPIDSLVTAGAILDDDIVLPSIPNAYIDKNDPRIEITVKESEKVGVFKDLEEYQNFKNINCNMCRKNEQKCSILKALKENRINEFVSNSGVCQKKKEI